VEAFAAPPFLSSPELSPNGQYFAARMVVQGETRLLLMPIHDRTVTPTVLGIKSDEVDIDWWQWVNDDWVLIGLSATSNVDGEDFRISRVGAVQRGTGKFVKLAWDIAAQNAGRVIWVARDGSPHILLGVQRSIYVGPSFWTEVIDIDVSTGKFKTIIHPREGVMNYYADASGTVRLGYGYDDARRTGRMLYRPNAKARFKIIEQANYKKNEKLNFPSMFLAAADKALTISDADGFDAVYELDLATLERGKKIFGVDGYDVDGLVSGPSGNALVGISLTEDRARTHWIDPGFAQTQAEIDKAVGVGRASIVSWSADQQKLLVQVGSANQVGSYFVYDRSTGGSMWRLSYADETLKMRKFAAVSTISYKARDGENIRAVLTLPTDRPAKNLPLIILPHGGPEARDSEAWDWWVQFLAWRGYAVVQPNYRGSTGFGSRFLDLGDGEWGLKMQDDLNDAVTHLAKQGLADPKRVCMAGGSYGGYAALRAAQRDGALYRCAVSFAGVSDLAGMARYDSQFLNGASAKAGWKESAPNLAAVSPVKHAEQFSIPVLIMHGKADLRVPVKQSREMAEKLKAAGKVYKYIEQPKGDHHFSRTEDRLQFLKEMDAFLQQYNPT
jgi:dipeptidyl aminopeptidase/acylaminoacyl peptidase